MDARRLGLLVTVLASMAAAPASAATWEGTCTIEGESTFDQPFGALPAPVSYGDRGTGTCTGTLNGAAVTDTPIRLAAEGMGSVGCLASSTVMFGTITFTRGTRGVADDVQLRYAGEGTGSLGQSVSRSRGAISGYGISYITTFGHSDPSTMQACQEATMRHARWTARTQTITPSVS